MGTIRFYCPPNRMSKEWAERGYILGFDFLPWNTWVDYQPGAITVSVEDSGSIRFFCPWYQKGMGIITLATGTLAQRDRPYILPIEIARAKIGSVRGQYHDWKHSGLVIPPEVTKYLEIATQSLGRAARGSWQLDSLDEILTPRLVSVPETIQAPPVMGDLAAAESSDESAEPPALTVQDPYPPEMMNIVNNAGIALQYALEAGNILVRRYIGQRMAVIANSKDDHVNDFGCCLGDLVPAAASTPVLKSIFQNCRIEYNWKKQDQLEKYDKKCRSQLEWCRANGIRPVIGPLLLFEDDFFPEWLALYQDDFDTVADYVRRHVEDCVEKFKEYSPIWLAAGGINTGSALGFNEEQRVNLTAVVLNTLDEKARNLEAGISLSQPFDEQLAHNDCPFGAEYYAKVLYNSGLKIDFIDLRMDIGFDNDGTSDRDLLQYSKMLDTWINSGLPISVSICTPGYSVPPAKGKSLRLPAWGGWTKEAQQMWVKRLLPLFLVKPKIRSVCWSTLIDPLENGLHGTGLFDSAGRKKPVMDTIIEMYNSFNKSKK